MKMRNFVKKSKRGQGHIIEVVLLIVVVVLVAIVGFSSVGKNINKKTDEINDYLVNGVSDDGDSSSGELPSELLYVEDALSNIQ